MKQRAATVHPFQRYLVRLGLLYVGSERLLLLEVLDVPALAGGEETELLLLLFLFVFLHHL